MRSDEIQQEILDLFAKNTGQYTPTPLEVQAINDGLRDLLRQIVPDTFHVVFNNDQPLKVCHNRAQTLRQIQVIEEYYNVKRVREGFSGLSYYIHVKDVDRSVESMDG